MVICKSPKELEKMYQAGQIVWGALEKMRTIVRPGISTKELDEFAEAFTAEHHARPAFKGYRGYPGSVCTSINQEVVHGIPSSKRKVREGDILSMDFGVELDGYFADAALTVPVGKVAPERQKLLRVTRESLEQGIEKIRPQCNRGSKRTVSLWCVSLWDTVSERRCTRTRSFRTTVRPDKASGFKRAWCWPSNRW